MKWGRPSLRRDLVLSFAILLTGAVLVAAISLALILPRIADPRTAFGLILVLLVADLGIMALFMRSVLAQRLVDPIEELVEGTGRIADGDFEHRLRPAETRELERLRGSINTLADELLKDQRLLAENVASLEHTNAELVAARDEVLRTARLASVGTLAAGIAHEVGNPLGALLGFADLARKQAERDGRNTDLLVSIRNEGERIDRIVRTLLEYARGRERGKVDVDAGSVVHRVRLLLESQGRLDGVATSWPDPETDLWVHLEMQQLEQVLVNLMLNALDAMSETDSPGLHVALRTEEGEVRRLPTRREDDPPEVDYRHRRRVSTDFQEGGPDLVFNASEVVVIEIRDTGPGIPEAHLDRVFDPFFTTKDPGKGTGLGLAICDRLVDGMGGRITVGNHPEGGALFTLRIPRTHPGLDA